MAYNIVLLRWGGLYLINVINHHREGGVYLFILDERHHREGGVYTRHKIVGGVYCDAN